MASSHRFLTPAKVREWLGSSLLSAVWLLLAWSIGTIVLDTRGERFVASDAVFQQAIPASYLDSLSHAWEDRLDAYRLLLDQSDSVSTDYNWMRVRVAELRRKAEPELLRDSVTLAHMEPFALFPEERALIQVLQSHGAAERSLWRKVWQAHEVSGMPSPATQREQIRDVQVLTMSFDGLTRATQTYTTTRTQRMKETIAGMRQLNDKQRLARIVLLLSVATLGGLWLFSRSSRTDSSVGSSAPTDPA